MHGACCPSRGELLAFLTGTLSGARFAGVAGHIESCADCEAQLARLESTADTMGSQLKGLPVHPANGSEDVPLSLLARVRAIRAQDGLTDWDSEDQ
jgi:anti-sigma factor RsiW